MIMLGRPAVELEYFKARLVGRLPCDVCILKQLQQQKSNETFALNKQVNQDFDGNAEKNRLPEMDVSVIW